MFAIVTLAMLIISFTIHSNAYAKERNTDDFITVTSNKYKFNGSGTKEDPFLISSIEDLKILRNNVDYGVSYAGYYFAQTEDLYFLEDENWNPIGEVKKGYPFEGNYDGCGHTMNNIYCTDPYAGLFSLLSGEVRNLGIESGCFKGDTIGSITSHGIGNTKIINCYNKASLIGKYRVGGITDNYTGQILFCWSLGKLSGEGADTVVSGISSYGTASIECCYTTESENLIDISTYKGKVTESFCIESNAIDDILPDIYTKIGEYKDHELISHKNLIFPVCRNGNLTFSEGIMPLKYVFVLAKGFYVEIFLVFVSVLFLIPFIIKSIKNRIPLQDSNYISPQKKKTNLAQSNQPDLSNSNQTPTTDKHKLFQKRSARNRFIAIITTSALFITGFSVTFNVLKNKYTAGVLNFEFYKKTENRNTDVLFLGGSSMSVNIELAELWKEYGISGYCLGGGNSTMYDNYYRLIEAQKLHSAKIIVVELRPVTYSSKYQGDESKMENVTGLSPSPNKLKYINTAVEPESRLDYLLDFPLYHNRYHSLSKWDFLHSSVFGLNDKGTWTIFYGNQYTPELIPASEITEYRAVNEKQEYYLRKIIEYCNKNTLPLLLIKTPDANRATNQPFYNTVGLIAKELNVPFLDFNQHDEAVGLLPEDFYYDANHLNVAGARKCTNYLGKYLKENYDLADHRGDADYRSWDLFTNNRENLYLRAITENADYFAELARDSRKITAIPYKLLEEKPEALLAVENALSGIPHEMLESDDIFYGNDAKEHIALGNNKVEIDKNFQNCTVSINNKDVISIASSGYLLIIYDEITGEIADVAGFTAENNFTLKHFNIGR